MKSFIEHVINEQELRMDRDLQNILRAHAKDYKAFKDGKQDILKAIHYCEMIIERDYK